MNELVTLTEKAIESLSNLGPVFFGFLFYLATRLVMQIYWGRRFEGPKEFADYYYSTLSNWTTNLASHDRKLARRIMVWFNGIGAKEARMPLQLRLFFLFVGLSILWTTLSFTISWLAVGTATIGGISLFTSSFSIAERVTVIFLLIASVSASLTVISWPNPYILTNALARRLGEPWKETQHLREIQANEVADVRDLVAPAPLQKTLLTTILLVILPIAFSAYLSVGPIDLYKPNFDLLPEKILFHVTQVVCICLVWSGITPIVATTFILSGALVMYVGFPIYLVAPLLLAASAQVSGFFPIAVNSVLVPTVVLTFAYLWQGQPEATLIVIALMINLPVAVAIYSDIAPRGQGKGVALAYALLSYAALSAILFFGQTQVSIEIAHAILAFWLLIPFFNAICDSISWQVTWRLLRRSENILAAQRTREDEQEQDPRDLHALLALLSVLLFVSLDVLSAIFFMVALSVVSFLMLHLANVVFALAGLSSRMDVDAIVQQIVGGQFFEPETFWLTFLLATTVIPTVVHIVIITTRVLSLVTARASIRLAVEQLESTDPDVNYSRFDFHWRSAKNNSGIIVGVAIAIVIYVAGLFVSVFESSWYGALLRYIATVLGLL